MKGRFDAIGPNSAIAVSHFTVHHKDLIEILGGQTAGGQIQADKRRHNGKYGCLEVFRGIPGNSGQHCDQGPQERNTVRGRCR